MSFKRLVVLSSVAVIAACSPSNGSEKGGGHGPMGGMGPSEVTVTTATKEALPVSWEYVGQTIGSREVEVRARVTGILLSRNFKEGDRVEEGEAEVTTQKAQSNTTRASVQAEQRQVRKHTHISRVHSVVEEIVIQDA